MKFAYLIMAFHQFDLLKKLLILLDDPRNDIYLHIDAKSKNQVEEALLRSCCKKAKLTFIRPINIFWGGYNMITCELALLAEATKSYHDYYHLLSGVDLPLKTQDEIHTFFSAHCGMEFLGVIDGWTAQANIHDRYSKYYWFQERDRRHQNNFWSLFDFCSRKLQEFLRVDRSKGKTFYGGSNWFSITHGFACYALEQRDWIKKTFHNTIICDEIFLQTVLMHSPFRENRYAPKASSVAAPGTPAARPDYCAILRYIDWTRGNPYVWKIDDVEELLASNFLFARKFSLDEVSQAQAAEKIYRFLLRKQRPDLLP